jgi:hypothetical protein
MEADFQNRRDHEDLRPPRTWAAQRAMDSRESQGRNRVPFVAAPLDDFRKSRDNPLKFQPVDQSERQKLAQHAQDVQRFREERQKLEADSAGRADVRNKDFVPGRAKLPGSPIAAKSGADLGKDQVPPKMYAVPKPDPNVVAKPRTGRSLDQPQPRTVNKVPLNQPEQPKKAPAPPQPLPKAEKAASQPHNAPAEAKQEQPKANDKGKDKN